MSIATMTSKGQITVPKDVRDDLGLVAGSKLLFVKTRSGHYRIVPRTGRIEDLAGLLHDPANPPMTVEEMNEIIAQAGVERGMRGLR